MSSVVLKNISKSYGKVSVIKDLNLEIRDKEFMVFVGPSGCGKSTLLRIIAGLEDIQGGEVYIDEKVVNNLHPKDRDIAMVFQNYALYPHMSVYENMAFALKIRKMDKNLIREKIENVAKSLNLTEYLNRKPKELSGGQKQRVALGRAMVREPKVFLMDEPLSNLDAKLRVQMRSEIRSLHKKLDTTFIYVTHDQVEALTMGDRITVLNRGEIQQVATPDEIYNYPENMFVAGFIGSPQMNFINVKVISENSLSFGDNTIYLTSDLIKRNNLLGKEVIAGIRPEHLSLSECSSSNKIEITAGMVEMLGSEKIVHFELQNHDMSAKLPASVMVAYGDKLCFSHDENKILLFDKESQKRYR